MSTDYTSAASFTSLGEQSAGKAMVRGLAPDAESIVAAQPSSSPTGIRPGPDSIGSTTRPIVEPTGPEALEFRVRRSGVSHRRLRLTGNRYTFGSAGGCSIRLNDPTLRAMHAVLIRETSRVLVRGYSEPIEVNGVQTNETRLQAGDILRLGAYEFELLTDTAAAPDPIGGRVLDRARPSSVLFDAPARRDLPPTDEVVWRERLRREVDQWRQRQEDCDRRESRIDEREAELRSRESELWSRADNLYRREARLQSQEAETFQLYDEFAARQQELMRLREESQGRQVDLQRREAEFREQEFEYRRRLAEATAQLDQSKLQAETATRAVERMREQFDALNAQIESLSREQQEIEVRETAASDEQRRLNEELESARAEVDRIKQESDQQRLSAEAHAVEMAAQIELLKASQGEGATSNREQLEESQRVADQLREQIEQLQRSVTEAGEESARLRCDYEQSCAQVEQLEALVSESQQRGDQDRDDWASEAEHLRGEVERLSNELSDANRQLAEVREANDTLNSRLNDVRQQRDDARTERDARPTTEAFQSLREELESASDQLAEMKRQYEETLQQLEQAQSDDPDQSETATHEVDAPVGLTPPGADPLALDPAADAVDDDVWPTYDIPEAATDQAVDDTDDFSAAILGDDTTVQNDADEVVNTVSDHRAPRTDSAWSETVASDSPAMVDDADAANPCDAAANTDQGDPEHSDPEHCDPEHCDPEHCDAEHRNAEHWDPEHVAESREVAGPDAESVWQSAWEDQHSDQDNTGGDADRGTASQWAVPDAGESSWQTTQAIDAAELPATSADTADREQPEALAGDQTLPEAISWGGTAAEEPAPKYPEDHLAALVDSEPGNCDRDDGETSTNESVGNESIDIEASARESNEQESCLIAGASPTAEASLDPPPALGAIWGDSQVGLDPQDSSQADSIADGSLASALIRDLQNDSANHDSCDPLDVESSNDLPAVDTDDPEWNTVPPASDESIADDPMVTHQGTFLMSDQPDSLGWGSDVSGAEVEPSDHRGPELDGGLWQGVADDDATTESDPQVGDPYAGEPLPTPAAEVLDSPDNVAAATDGDEQDDDSIEAYMNRLLRRVQGDHSDITQSPVPETLSVSTSTSQSSHLSESKPNSEPSADDTSVAQSQPIDADAPLVPRSQAPERSGNLSAMRDLANSSARSAISRSARAQSRDTQIQALISFACAVGALACNAFAFHFLSGPLLIVAIAMTFIIAFCCVREGLQLLREASRRVRAADGCQVAETESGSA